ncbi:MAG: helix-turn-helix domain-containing protein [Oligoflexales bacterium]
MQAASLTVREGADIAGVPTSTLQDWRAGRTPTNFKALRNLCKALGVSLSYLLTGEEDEALPLPAPNSIAINEHVYEVTVRPINRKNSVSK